MRKDLGGDPVPACQCESDSVCVLDRWQSLWAQSGPTDTLFYEISESSLRDLIAKVYSS